LKDPHAAALWDFRVVGGALVIRRDLNDPHAAPLWDFRVLRGLVIRRDLNDPHAAALWFGSSGLTAALKSLNW